MFFKQKVSQKLSQKQRILNLLTKSKHGITSWDLINMRILAYSRRIADLRQDGHVIRTVRIKPGVFKYYLNK